MEVGKSWRKKNFVKNSYMYVGEIEENWYYNGENSSKKKEMKYLQMQ